jgi:hypothetical protein
MTFLERPMPTDNNDVCIWRDRISGAVIENEGTGGSAYNLTSSGGVRVDTHPCPFFFSIITISQTYSTPSVPQFDVTNGLTISMWIKSNNFNASDFIFSKRNAVPIGSSYDTASYLNSSLLLSGGTQNNIITISGPDVFAKGEWAHIGVTVAPGGTTCSFYLNGELIGSTSRSGSLGTNLGPWTIGGPNDGTTSHFKGFIWDVRVATIERSANWFYQSYDRGITFLSYTSSKSNQTNTLDPLVSELIPGTTVISGTFRGNVPRVSVDNVPCSVRTAGDGKWSAVVSSSVTSTTMVALGQTSRQWRGLAALGNDMYACVDNGDIYRQINGEGNFLPLGQTSRAWRDLGSLGNDLYACVWSGNIYKRFNGAGDFLNQDQDIKAWFGLHANGNDMYSCVYIDVPILSDIYKQTNGTGSFVDLDQGSGNWHSIAAVNNNVYSCIYGGDIYMQTGGTGAFTGLLQTSRNWTGLSPFGQDMYACVNSGDIYRQVGGVGNFVSLGQTNRSWRNMAPLGKYLYASVLGGDIYRARLLADIKVDGMVLGTTAIAWG